MNPHYVARSGRGELSASAPDAISPSGFRIKQAGSKRNDVAGKNQIFNSGGTTGSLEGVSAT